VVGMESAGYDRYHRSMHLRRAVRAVLLAVVLLIPAGVSWPQRALTGAGTVVAAYEVVDGVARVSPQVDPQAGGTARQRTYDAVEAYVWGALPPQSKRLVSRLELFVVPDNSGDASDGTATENPDGAGWTLALDEVEGEKAIMGTRRSDRLVFDEVIAHEVGHVLSLNEAQRAGESHKGSYSDENGAFADSAYLNRFYQRFWKRRDGHRAVRGGSGGASRLYEERPDAFVTEYAATDPSEDFAESFAYFVLEIRPFSRSEKAEKLRFFYAYPELVNDRRFMRNHLSSVK
jgi:hypothetical protein